MTYYQDYHTEIAGTEVSFLVSYSYSPGTPMVRYLRNGDPGYPAEPPEIEIEKIERIVEKDEKTTYEAIPQWLEQIIIDSDDFFARLYDLHEDYEPDYEPEREREYD